MVHCSTGNHGHGGRPGKVGGSGGKSGKRNRKKESLPMTEKEKYKVGKDINSVYHVKYKGKSSCFIKTRSNEEDSPFYLYRFKNHGFDNYDIYMKEDYE